MSASEVDVVPVIDISPTLRADADAAAKQAVIDALGDACARCGFFMVKGHGVPESLIRDFWASARAFFDEPLAVKESCPMTDSYVYGYAGMSTEKAGHEKGADKSYDTSDLKESFQVCLSSEEAPAKGLPTPQWPPSPAGFKELTTAYYRAMEKLAAQLLSLLAQALKVEPDFFDPTLKSHWSSLRILNYPHMTTPPNPGQLRIAPHSDYGAITLLRADDVPGGLQLLMKGGEWKDVVIPPDAYTVNLGDLMARWTNDKWRSTMHRVVCPPIDIGRDTRRQSCAYFCNIAREATVTAIPTCVDEAHPAKYPPINAFDHLMERHARAMGAKKAFRPEDAAEAEAAAAKPAAAS